MVRVFKKNPRGGCPTVCGTKDAVPKKIFGHESGALRYQKEEQAVEHAGGDGEAEEIREGVKEERSGGEGGHWYLGL